jgi:lysophospholipase L1-like esterase
MKSAQLFAEYLLRSFLLPYALSWAVVGALTLIAALLHPIFAVVIPIIGFFVLEGAFRTILLVAYGSAYKNAIFTYFLVDSDRYGTALRPSTNSRAVESYIFDKFVFPPNSKRILDLDENIRSRVVFSVNSLGFRGPEFSPETKRARLRIFCMGGSTTAGDSNDDAQTWPAQLERIFLEKGYEVEVINAGIEGWYSYKDFLRFRDEISTYGADIVLLHQGWNEEFVWSSLALGKKWRPELLRNVREEHMLYSPPNHFLSSSRFLTKFLFIQSILKFVFKKNMSFQNPRRWESLRARDYVVAWTQNMLKIAAIAQSKNVMLYTINYPGLVSMHDTDDDRALYVQNTRLSPRYADYQAIAKERIENTLTICNRVIPMIDTMHDFTSITGQDRLQLFFDEIHMTPRGNQKLAESIARLLIEDPSFQKRYASPANPHTNITSDAVLRDAGHNDPSIEKSITDALDQLVGGRKRAADVPTERYTTF